MSNIILRTPSVCKSIQNADCSADLCISHRISGGEGRSELRALSDGATFWSLRLSISEKTRHIDGLDSVRASRSAHSASSSASPLCIDLSVEGDDLALQVQQQQQTAAETFNRPMGVSEFFHSVWDLVRRPFEECTSCCDVLDPDYYRKTSPGVRRTPQMFNRYDDVKYDFPKSRPPSSLPPSSSSNSHAGMTQRSNMSSGSGSRSSSRSASPMNYSYEEEEERHVQFLFYGGSDPPTPTSAGGLGGYRSDMISNYVEPISPAAFASPRINHEMPCFFSPRDTPAQSPMSAPIYSPHLFKISEQRHRRSAGYYSRYSR